ncbi:MAG: HD-GYP domain-containing protein [Velocimicrobium sp.]
MRKILVKNIKGNEILAKSIVSDMDTILMSKGTLLKKNYATKLSELNVESIYIEDAISQGINEHEITENEIKEQCQSIVAETINKYAYSGNSEFEKLKDVAANIIDDMLSQPEVMFNISGVRQKSEEIYSHSLNVCALSVLVALRLNLPKKKINDIAVGSVLHDIGYLNLSAQIDEKTLRMHVIQGYSIVENEDWISRDSKEIILSHHELIDGSGYPMRITGDKMKIGTKIVSICNMFDNLVYGKHVKQMKVYEAIERIVGMGGQKFDMDVTRVFNESVAAYPIGTIIKTSEEETGIILRQNNKCPTRPVIRILNDKNGKKLDTWIERDLTKELTLFIKETLDDY